MADVTKIVLVLPFFFLRVWVNVHQLSHYIEEDGIFLCFLIFIFLWNIQKQLSIIISPHIWRPLALRHCCSCCFRYFSRLYGDLLVWHVLEITWQLTHDYFKMLSVCTAVFLSKERGEKKAKKHFWPFFFKYPHTCGQGLTDQKSHRRQNPSA